MSSRHQGVSSNINSFNVNSNNIFNLITQLDGEGHQILQWLSPFESQKQHQCIRIDRLDGVGNGVLETTEFRKWSDKEDGCDEPVLYCYGNLGVGKTYVCSLVIDTLCNQARGDIAVVGLYCDFRAQPEQSTTCMLGAILKQLFSGGGIPEYIRDTFQKARREFGGRELRLPDLVGILKRTIAPLERVFICIDALDESSPKHRRELLESLREIIRVSPNTRIFLTGRPHIEDEIVKCFREAVRIPVSPTQDDIKSYLEMRLSRDTDPDAMDDELRADIMRIIPAKISEIMDAILGEITIHQRRKRLDQMIKGEGQGSAYELTLSRVKAQQRSRSKLGMEVLMWVSHSERPLHVDELRHALGVEEGSLDLNIDNIPSMEKLLACSLGLVTVEKSSSTVRLIHDTLQEYLFDNPDLFIKPHSKIAEVCLTYLNFRHVRGFSPTLCSIPVTVPFVEYASCHWGTHSGLGTTENVKRLALELFDDYDMHISSKVLLLHGSMDSWDWPLDQEDSPRGFSGLHGAAYLGCEEIIGALLEMNKWDLRVADFGGNTAITWAASRGHEGVVRMLLERDDVDPNIANRCGRTPLLWAARNGHEGVVRMLLERDDVDPNTADTQYGRTPLSLAAETGRARVVRMLLGRNDVGLNTADTQYGRTPLSWAAENGHARVVRMLLKRNDVDPNIAGIQYGQTPLSWAARNGHAKVVRMLLKRNDVDPNMARTQYGRTPLSWAAENGHEEVVRMLLKRDDVNPNIADDGHGRTPLCWATRNGHERIAGFLRERVGSTPRYAPSLLSSEPSFPESSGLSTPRPKRRRKF